MHYYTAAEPWHFDQACFNNDLYFAGQAATDWTNIELYKYNSTTGSVTMVKDIMDDGNADPGANGDSDPDDLTPCNGLLFFTAQDADHGRELWVTDGTTANTRMVVDLNGTSYDSYYGDFYCHNNKLMFRASPSYSAYQQIYTSDGTASGTVAAGIQPRLGSGNWGAKWLTHNGVLYFRGIDNWASSTKDYAVYAYQNGVARKVEDVYPSEMSTCGDKILINYDDTESGNELYALDLASGVVGSGSISPMALLLQR
jgi:ELWxxDGT repeat protein